MDMNPESAPLGGGTGGGPTSCDRSHYVTGTHGVSANQIELVSRPPLGAGIADPSVITLLAAGEGTDGLVNVRGSQGVRITAGPPLLPPTSSESTDGVEIVTGELQKVTLQRGLLPAVDQKIEMTPDAITIDAGKGKVTIQSLTEITLSVAGGVTRIKLGPEGVTIEALQIKLSAQVQAEVQALMNKITGSAMNQISGGITMIG
jgi:hypothetical protein